MPDKYGTNERAALILLALENRELPNSELRNDYGIELQPQGRDRLNKAGLLRSRLDKRRYFHTITDAGKAWCERELTNVEPPARSGPLVRVVFEFVQQLIGYLRQRDIRLDDVIVESLIRTAYRELSVKPQDWVRLAKLRPKLNGADKDEVDRVLLAMSRTGLVHLSPDSNRKALTDADHAAAIKIGSEHKHLVAIEES